MTIKAVLKKARIILAGHYVKWQVYDSKKHGYCVYGAVSQAQFNSPYMYPKTAMEVVNTIARKLHPELIGTSKLRETGGHDYFDDHPAVFVNNQLGKKATLAMLDEAIKNAKGRVSIKP